MPIAQLVLIHHIYSASIHALASETPPKKNKLRFEIDFLAYLGIDPIHLFHTFFLTCPPVMAVLEREEHLLASPVVYLVIVSILLLSPIRFFGVNQFL